MEPTYQGVWAPSDILNIPCLAPFDDQQTIPTIPLAGPESNISFCSLPRMGGNGLQLCVFFAGSSAKNKGQLSSVMFSLSLAILLSKHTYFHVFLLFSIPES
jgi:hypothetical protein